MRCLRRLGTSGFGVTKVKQTGVGRVTLVDRFICRRRRAMHELLARAQAAEAERDRVRFALFELAPIAKSVRDGFEMYGDERVDDLLAAVEEAIRACGPGADE